MIAVKVVESKLSYNGKTMNTTHSVEFSEEKPISEIIGSIDSMLRRFYPDAMRHRTLNLSRDTTNYETRNAGHAPIRNEIFQTGTIPIINHEPGQNSRTPLPNSSRTNAERQNRGFNSYQNQPMSDVDSILRNRQILPLTTNQNEDEMEF